MNSFLTIFLEYTVITYPYDVSQHKSNRISPQDFSNNSNQGQEIKPQFTGKAASCIRRNSTLNQASVAVKSNVFITPRKNKNRKTNTRSKDYKT